MIFSVDHEFSFKIEFIFSRLSKNVTKNAILTHAIDRAENLQTGSSLILNQNKKLYRIIFFEFGHFIPKLRKR